MKPLPPRLLLLQRRVISPRRAIYSAKPALEALMAAFSAIFASMRRKRGVLGARDRSANTACHLDAVKSRLKSLENPVCRVTEWTEIAQPVRRSYRRNKCPLSKLQSPRVGSMTSPEMVSLEKIRRWTRSWVCASTLPFIRVCPFSPTPPCSTSVSIPCFIPVERKKEQNNQFVFPVHSSSCAVISLIFVPAYLCCISR